MPVLHLNLILTPAQRLPLAIALATIVSLAGHRARALSTSGAWAAVAVGATAFAFGGALVAVAVIALFVSGSVLSRLGGERTASSRALASKSGRRDAGQVLANGGIAAACTVIAALAGPLGWGDGARWLSAAVCALAAASGDTWSTEVGQLARGAVRSIIGLRRVPAGTSGGVSLAGTVASLAGGAFVGSAGALAPAIAAFPHWLALGAVAGCAGSLLDSVLGATLQAVWRCPRCGLVAETRAHDGGMTLVRGIAWLDNDAVNTAATALGAVVGYLAATPAP